MQVHHRNIAYRPPRRAQSASASAGLALYLRFARDYLLPHKWPLLVCVVLTSLNACSVYLMAYYGRVVVDNILEIRAFVPPTPVAASGLSRPRLDAPSRAGTSLAPQGLGRQIGLGQTTGRRPPGAEARLWRMFLLYVGTLVLLNYLTRVAQQTEIAVGRRVAGSLREDMHERVMKLSIAYHKSHTPGRLMARIISDVDVVQQQMLTSLMMASRSLAMILTGFGILLVLEWRAAALLLAILPVYMLVYGRARVRIRDVNRELRHTNSCLYGLVSQKLDGIKAIQAYGREGLENVAFHRLAACFLRDAVLQQRLGAGVGRSTQVISSSATGSIFLYGAWLVMHGGMTLGQMMYVYGTTANLFMPVLQIAQLHLVFSNLLVVLQRVAEVLDQPLEIVDAPDAVDFPRPLKKGITLRNVRFQYQYNPDEETEVVLRNISVQVPAGTWLCIMGASGSGKTTLLYLLARLYEPRGGQILVDGTPLGKIRSESLREAVGFVPQEAQIFSGTVRDNICYGIPDASPSQIMAAAKAAEMHDFIMSMPVQYETLIGEKGMSLSGGQRQRLSLARALLTDPNVLVLDDCTSALDADTERRIQETLSQTLVGKTAVIVSQRVSMAKRCHRICMIENGVVAEFGTHAELLASGGFYSRLHAQQTQ